MVSRTTRRNTIVVSLGEPVFSNSWWYFGAEIWRKTYISAECFFIGHCCCFHTSINHVRLVKILMRTIGRQFTRNFDNFFHSNHNRRCRWVDIFPSFNWFFARTFDSGNFIIFGCLVSDRRAWPNDFRHFHGSERKHTKLSVKDFEEKFKFFLISDIWYILCVSGGIDN